MSQSSGKGKLKQNTTTHLLECPKLGKLIKPTNSEDVEQQKLSFIASENENGSITSKDYLNISQKTEHQLPYDWVIMLLDNYKGAETYIHTKLCTQMLIRALFIIGKTKLCSD